MPHDVLYLIAGVCAFSLLHSFTASVALKQWMRDAVGSRIHDGWYRVAYNALSLVTLLPLLIISLRPSTILWSVGEALAIVFRMIEFAGVAGIVVSLKLIDWKSFIGVRQILQYFRPKITVATDTLVTTGPYRFVRHPLYFFSLLVIWFVPVMTINWMIFSVGVSLYFFIGSFYEESKMVHQFGDPYRRYQQRVPRLLPLNVFKPIEK